MQHAVPVYWVQVVIRADLTDRVLVQMKAPAGPMQCLCIDTYTYYE